MTGRITARQFHEAAGVGDWRVLDEGACTYFRTGSFEAGARLVQAIAELGGLDDHPHRPARPRAVVLVPAHGRAAPAA
jgi:4a-hydroxytetrahydrobiopterin dehydratase